jgi:hypothetical protein
MLRQFALSITALVTLGLASANAASVDSTGNPTLGGWNLVGNSLDTGVYVQGNNRYNYDLYWTSFTLDAGSPLLGTGFQVGDQVIGIGAVLNGYTHTDGSYTAGGVPVSDLGQLNAKFGTLTPVGTTPLYAADSDGLGGVADGHGSQSGGNGGTGSVQLAVGSQLASNGLQYVRLDRTLRHDGTSSAALGSSSDTDYLGRYVGDVTSSKLTSFEFFLSNDELLRQGYTAIPLGAGFVATVQHVSNFNYFTDSYGQTLAPASVPAPTAAFGGTALLGMLLAFSGKRLRRHV